MKNSAFLLPTFFCIFFVSSILASPKLSIYDPLGALGNEERVKLEAEGQALITSRKVNGQDVLIQIDFLSKHEFEEGGITGRDAEGRTLFSLGTYANWSARYFSGPAVLMLFLDQGDGTYVLDALNFSDMLMDEGIPDLVRRYIRDEIMKKETGYEAIISSGLYAIGEALNPEYKQRLVLKHLELFRGNQFKRRYSYYYPFNYYEFQPDHNHNSNHELLPDVLNFVDNDTYFDWSLISYSNTEKLDVSKEYTGNIPWYNEYFKKTITVPDLRDIIDNPLTSEENELLITNTFRRDLIEIANNLAHYLNEDLTTHDKTLLPLAFNGEHPVSQGYRLDRFGCTIKIKKKILAKQWEPIPDVINRAIYPNWGPKGPTWCNQYARAVTAKIFDSPIFTSMNANDVYDYMKKAKNEYIEINNYDAWDFVNSGFLVFLVWKNPSGRSGHLEILLPNDVQTIDSDGDPINTGAEEYSIGAGGIMYAKSVYVNDSKFNKFLYLGHLKKTSL